MKNETCATCKHFRRACSEHGPQCRCNPPKLTWITKGDIPSWDVVWHHTEPWVEKCGHYEPREV